MSAKSARTDPAWHDRSGPCGFAPNVGRVQFDGNWEAASHTALMQVASQRGAYLVAKAPAIGEDRSHAKAGRDARRCRPGGDDARRRRYRDGLSAQPYGLGQGGRKWPSTARAICQHGSDTGVTPPKAVRAHIYAMRFLLPAALAVRRAMTTVAHAQPKATTGQAIVTASSRKRGPKPRTGREIDPKVGAKVDAFFARMVRPPDD